MDEQAPQSNPLPETPPVQTPPAQSASSVTPPPSKSFLSGKLIILIVILLIIFAGGGAYLALNSKTLPAGRQAKPSISPTSAPTSIPDPTANWKQFNDTETGIGFKYPINYKLEVRNADYLLASLLSPINSTRKSQEGLGIDELKIEFLLPQPTSYSLEQIINTAKQQPNERGTDPLRFEAKDTVIGGVNAKILTTQYSSVYYIVKDKNLIQIIKYPSITNHQAEFDQILSTFKFTDANQTTDTSSWKTYTNSVYSFSFKYPSDWKYLQLPNSGYPGVKGDQVWVTNQDFPPPNTDGRPKMVVYYSQGTGCELLSEQEVSNYLKEPVRVGGEAGTRITGTSKFIGWQFNNVYVYKNSICYLIMAGSFEQDFIEKFNQILSTFRFDSP